MVSADMKAITLALLMLLAVVLQSSQAAKPENLIPLRVDLETLQLPEGLQLERKSVREETVDVDGREVVLRHYVFRFLSQRFMDEDWWHEAHLIVPVKLADEARGRLFLASRVVN